MGLGVMWVGSVVSLLGVGGSVACTGGGDVEGGCLQVVFVGDGCVARLLRLAGARLCVVQLALVCGKGVLA